MRLFSLDKARAVLTSSISVLYSRFLSIHQDSAFLQNSTLTFFCNHSLAPIHFIVASAWVKGHVADDGGVSKEKARFFESPSSSSAAHRMFGSSGCDPRSVSAAVARKYHPS